MKSLLKILLFSLFVLLVGCSTRKVQKSTEVQKETTTEAVKIDEVKTDSSKTNIIENCDETIIEPIDTIAPMVIDGKVYKNARLRRLNKIVNTNVENNIKEVKTAIKNTKKDTTSEIIKKEIQRKSFCWWWLLLILIIPIYYLFKKYKDLFWLG